MFHRVEPAFPLSRVLDAFKERFAAAPWDGVVLLVAGGKLKGRKTPNSSAEGTLLLAGAEGRVRALTDPLLALFEGKVAGRPRRLWACRGADGPLCGRAACESWPTTSLGFRARPRPSLTTRLRRPRGS